MGKRVQYRLNTDIFIERSKKTHGDRYDYSKSVYVNKRTKIKITCPIHGDFLQCPQNHMKGQGCPECGKKYASEWRCFGWESFVSESNKRFNGEYSFPYIKDEYRNSHSKVTIKCDKCGNYFKKIACDHITSNHGGCISCYANTSYNEKALSKYIISLVGEDNVMLRDRTILKGRELDIYVPSKNIAIEYNGLFWHCEAQKPDKFYHLKKTEECASKGVRLIQIFEDEYVNKEEIVKRKIRHILGFDFDAIRVMARKCTVGIITKKEAEQFLNTYHIQGFVASSVYTGCFFNEKLIGVMSFKKEKTQGKWELTRFATDYGYKCNGVGGKLFKWFIKNYKPIEVKSFADRRWTEHKNGNLYTKLGFSLTKTLLPDYRYIYGKALERYHKFGFRKQTLHKKHGLPLDMTEKEMTDTIRAFRIYDCGLYKYVWKNFEINS